jgi:flagellar hook-length control protein FliK
MTSAISSFIAPAAPPAQPQPNAATSQPNQPNGFAKLLSQRQAMAAHEPVHVNKTQPAEKPAEAQEPVSPQSTAPSANKAVTRDHQPAKTDKPKSPQNTSAEKGDEAKAADTSAEKTEDSAATDPALADWMSALNLPPTTPADAPAAAGKGTVMDGSPLEASGVDGAAAGKAGRTSTKGLAVGTADTAAGNGTAVAQRGEATNDPAERIRTAREGHGKPEAMHADAQANSAWQAAVERVAAPEEAKSRNEVSAAGAAGAAGQLTPSAKAAEAAAPTVVNVPTPATAAEFPKELGVQISVLAKDGVQQAELHLNPADMGPISVQISLDGTQAQVNFGADSAATRQIIEGGLPELAAAMRDAGFTLSGGGVHQQAQGRREGGGSSGGDGSGRGGSAGEADAPARRATARMAAGGVDLYA